MRYIFVFTVGVALTALYLSNEESNEARVRRQATDFCSCHKGVDVFVYTPDDFAGYLELQCKDGLQVTAKGTTDNIQLGGGDDCQD